MYRSTYVFNFELTYFDSTKSFVLCSARCTIHKTHRFHASQLIITEKIGEKYPLLFTGTRAAPTSNSDGAAAPPADKKREPDSCKREGAFLQCIADRKALEGA